MAKSMPNKKKVFITSIQISKETKKRLGDLGKKGETYEDIIKKLLQK